MTDQRLYGLIGQMAADSFTRSQELLETTIKTSEIGKSWLYRERRTETMCLSLVTGLTLVWAVTGAWPMLIASVCSSFKLVRAVDKTLLAHEAILGYRQLSTERVHNYGQPEDKPNLTPIVRGGSTAKARRDQRRSQESSG